VNIILLYDFLRDPGSGAALALEHVKGSPGRRVKHTGRELGLIAAAAAGLRDGVGESILVHPATSARTAFPAS
jgi:hypothetical protein